MSALNEKVIPLSGLAALLFALLACGPIVSPEGSASPAEPEEKAPEPSEPTEIVAPDAQVEVTLAVPEPTPASEDNYSIRAALG